MGEGLGDGLGFGLGDGDGLGVGDGLGEGDGVGDGDGPGGVGVGVRVPGGVAGVGSGISVDVGDGVVLAVAPATPPGKAMTHTAATRVAINTRRTSMRIATVNAAYDKLATRSDRRPGQ